MNWHYFFKMLNCLPGTTPEIFKRDLKPRSNVVQGPPPSPSLVSATSGEWAMNFYLHLWPNSSQDSWGRSQTRIYPFVFRDLHTKMRQIRQITMQIPLWTKRKILFCRIFNLATIKSISLSLKEVNIATRRDKAVLFSRTLLFIPTTERRPTPGPTPPIDTVHGSSIKTTDNNSLGTSALPFLQHPASEQTAATLPLLQRQPARAQSGERGLGEHCPQGPRSWFFLHKQPLPHQHSSLFQWPVYVRTHSPRYSWSCRKPAVPHSSWFVPSLTDVSLHL